MLKLYKSGISLIVLVITIIVIIILSGAVLLSLAINNPIGQATKATFLNDLSAFKSELNTYVSSQYANTLGSFDPTRLQADENSLTYMGTVDTGKSINDVIPSLSQNEKYTGSFEIINGRLAYSGENTSQQEWAREQNLPVLATDYPDVTIAPIGNAIASSGTDVIYNIEITSAAEITTVNLEGKLEVLDGSGTPIAAQPTIIFDQLSGTPIDIIRQIRVTIKTDTLSEGSYLVRLRQGAIGNSLNLSNPKDSIDLAGFTIDNEAPVNPIITPNIMTWTNDSVDVAIKYSEDTVLMQYSLDSITWNTYNGAITVTDNNTTIYARGLDNAGNESGISTITIANIDKEAPTLDVTDGGTTSSSVRIQATAIDAGGSGINPGSYQYSKDDGVTWTAATSSTSYTFDGLATGEYQCRVKVSDNAGNSVVSNEILMSTIQLGTISMNIAPTAWTYGNVIVTISYPAEIITKEYSINGTTWNTYTGPVDISSNLTVYARGFDAGNNQTSQATITISNIDKESPTVTASSGNVTTSSIQVIADATDSGTSGLNESSYQYSKDDGTTWSVATSDTTHTFTGLSSGTYNCKVKVTDNAGNIGISNTIVLATEGLGTISLSASPTGWTNGNVSVTINYPAEIVTKEYSTNGTTWNVYTAPVVVTSNLTVYARGFDAGNNQTSQATITVSNIDKTAPSISATNAGTTTSSITVGASASDTGGSGIKSGSYEYSKDNGTTWTTATSATSYNFTGLTTGSYNFKVRVSDNAGNVTTSPTLSISTKALGGVSLVASPTGWTNGNVSVAITYPAEIVTKQYSTNGSTWSTYTSAVIVTANNTTVYARGYDAANNQTAQATLTVSNIDKVAPTVSFGTNGATDVETASSKVTISDTGGSGINTGTLQYVWANQNTTTPGSGWASFTNGGTVTYTATSGTYYLWVKASDNAGNSVVSKTNAFTFALDWNASKGVNKPKLAPGMTPIKWSGTTVVTTTESDSAWYDYPNKVWANAQTADGSMWVWIPRYEYRIPTPHSSTAQTIQINFKQNLTTTATSGYRVHPAFTFGSTQLTGIWIAKFEAGGTTGAVDVKPGVSSLRSLNMSDMFTASRNMETNSRYGWGTSGSGIDTHFIKNIEWGCAAYLGNSAYGKNAKITPNSNSSYITGGGSGTTYISNGAQSTTGNVYGIYDMAGGNWEFVAALPSNNNYNITANASALMNADVKYRDMYVASPDNDASNYANAASKYGDAIYETSSSYMNETAWYGGYSYMIYGSQIAFVRGGVAMATSLSNPFATNVYSGGSSGVHGFRPALAVASGL